MLRMTQPRFARVGMKNALQIIDSGITDFYWSRRMLRISPPQADQDDNLNRVAMNGI
jgi:hypothetical protein